MSKKGRQYEFWVREAIASSLNLDKEDLVIRSASESGADVYPTARARKLFPFAVEAKNQKTIKLKEYWKQAQRNAGEGLCPVVCFKAAGLGKTAREAANLVILDMETFIGLLSARREDVDIAELREAVTTPKVSEARLR